MEPVRLHKLLAAWGIASRRAVEAMVAAGRIRVDGEPFTDPGRKVSPASRIEIDGRPVGPPAEPTAAPVVLAFHKPAGVLSSLADQFGRPTLRQFFPGPADTTSEVGRGRRRGRSLADPTGPMPVPPPAAARLYPIGRLDADSTGLLLMTNDGELTNRLLHPRYKVEKEYRVRFGGGALTAAELDRFAAGLTLDDGPTAPCRITPTGREECLVVLREGRKRQIKRMFAALGRQVTGLHRVRFGPIRLRNLPPGEARPLAPDEMRALLAAAGLDRPGRPRG